MKWNHEMWLAQINICFSFLIVYLAALLNNMGYIYIICWKDDCEYWEGSGPALFKVTVPLLLGEVKEISHCSRHLKPGVKHG
jgi:hypothetical protein